MSYDISLVDPTTNEIVQVEPHEEGGTYLLGGNNLAELNITYNYGKYYYEHLDKEQGIRWLYGKTAGTCVPKLLSAVRALGVDRYTGEFWVWKIDFILDGKYKKYPEIIGEDGKLIKETDLFYDQIQYFTKLGVLYDTGGYWKPTPGNAGYALNILLNWAIQHPTAVFEGD